MIKSVRVQGIDRRRAAPVGILNRSLALGLVLLVGCGPVPPPPTLKISSFRVIDLGTTATIAIDGTGFCASLSDYQGSVGDCGVTVDDTLVNIQQVLDHTEDGAVDSLVGTIPLPSDSAFTLVEVQAHGATAMLPINVRISTVGPSGGTVQTDDGASVSFDTGMLADTAAVSLQTTTVPITPLNFDEGSEKVILSATAILTIPSSALARANSQRSAELGCGDTDTPNVGLTFNLSTAPSLSSSETQIVRGVFHVAEASDGDVALYGAPNTQNGGRSILASPKTCCRCSLSSSHQLPRSRWSSLSLTWHQRKHALVALVIASLASSSRSCALSGKGRLSVPTNIATQVGKSSK